MKKIIQEINLHLGNRDGDLYAVEADDGGFYLVLTAETMHVEEEFETIGSAFCTEISKAAFHALTTEPV